MTFHIRKAQPKDAAAIVDVHVTAWRETYAGLLKQDMIEDIATVVNMTKTRNSIMTNRDLSILSLIAENEAGDVIGFCDGGLARELAEIVDGQIYLLYIQKQHRRIGIGRALMEKMGEHFKTLGAGPIALGVIENNQPARRFFEKMGGAFYSEMETLIKDGSLVEAIYAWEEPEALINATHVG
jgi:ribosomal protein S18 acetylase RimI-like enzyme